VEVRIDGRVALARRVLQGFGVEQPNVAPVVIDEAAFLEPPGHQGDTAALHT
jgi:hypothetical protein